jgi:hypothetical protein
MEALIPSLFIQRKGQGEGSEMDVGNSLLQKRMNVTAAFSELLFL